MYVYDDILVDGFSFHAKFGCKTLVLMSSYSAKTLENIPMIPTTLVNIPKIPTTLVKIPKIQTTLVKIPMIPTTLVKIPKIPTTLVKIPNRRFALNSI